MATFKLRADPLAGETGLVVYIYTVGGAVANGAGDALTESSGLFSATVGESLTGRHEYSVKDGDGLTRWIGEVYCVGTVWNADDPGQVVYPSVQRSLNDENAISIWWPVSGATLTGNKSIDNGAWAAITGAFASTVITAGGYYLYTLAYNAADRPAGEGTVLYEITDGTRTGYLTLEIIGGASNITTSTTIVES